MTEPATAAWRVDRAERIAKEQTVADDMVGKTITAATVEPHMDNCDGSNVLRLTMTDGSVYAVEGNYGGYTGHSCDEYVELLTVERVLPDAD